MRSITKGTGRYQLSNRHTAHLKELAAGIASPKAWKNFHGKQGTKVACLSEQYSLCAWSEIRLDVGAWGMHLDHVEPKSIAPQRTFDHSNLVLSAFSSQMLANMKKDDIFGGHFRKNRYSKSGFITPLTTNCRRYFHYASDGTVAPALGLSDSERRKARYTIAILNLNSPLLVNRRRRWLQELEEAIDMLLNNAPALEQFADQELCLTGNRLRPFHSAVRERFGGLGGRVIKMNCQQCA